MNDSSLAGPVFQHRPKDECGVFAVFGHPHAAEITFFGLYALQHRGQESAGIVVGGGKGNKFKSHHGMGLVSQVFNDQQLALLPGTRAIGHVRYSTTGSSILENAQPIVAIARAVRSRWVTMETWSTPINYAMSLRPRAPFSRPPLIARSFFT